MINILNIETLNCRNLKDNYLKSYAILVNRLNQFYSVINLSIILMYNSNRLYKLACNVAIPNLILLITSRGFLFCFFCDVQFQFICF